MLRLDTRKRAFISFIGVTIDVHLYHSILIYIINAILLVDTRIHAHTYKQYLAS